jgi:hypothetical protein
MVMQCNAQGDKSQLATTGHWQVVAELLEAARESIEEAPVEPVTPEAVVSPVEMITPEITAVKMKKPSAEEVAAAQARLRRLTAPIRQVEVSQVPPPKADGASEVIDLADDQGSSVVDAVMRHSMAELVECPLRPPMCPEARLAVSRDRRMMLIASAGKGLADLRNVGLAYRWLVENRALVAMALPQFAVDARQLPHLRLLVDQADLNAEILQPILQANTVTVHSYRKLRWGERNGLLLEAA